MGSGHIGRCVCAQDKRKNKPCPDGIDRGGEERYTLTSCRPLQWSDELPVLGWMRSNQTSHLQANVGLLSANKRRGSRTRPFRCLRQRTLLYYCHYWLLSFSTGDSDDLWWWHIQRKVWIKDKGKKEKFSSSSLFSSFLSVRKMGPFLLFFFFFFFKTSCRSSALGCLEAVSVVGVGTCRLLLNSM